MGVQVHGVKRLARQFDAVVDSMDRARMQKVVRSAAELVADEARRNARHFSSRVAAAIRVRDERPRRPGGVAAGIRIGHPLWHLIEFGTRAHTINVKSKRVLTRGGKFFGRSVEHPGQKERPYLRPAFEAKHRVALQSIAAMSRANLRAAVRRAV